MNAVALELLGDGIAKVGVAIFILILINVILTVVLLFYTIYSFRTTLKIIVTIGEILEGEIEELDHPRYDEITDRFEKSIEIFVNNIDGTINEINVMIKSERSGDNGKGSENAECD